jgi:hypothetical protein
VSHLIFEHAYASPVTVTVWATVTVDIEVVLGVDVACAAAIGEECGTPSLTTQLLQGASRDITAGRAAAPITLGGRRRQVRRMADGESLVEYIGGISSSEELGDGDVLAGFGCCRWKSV